MTMLRYLDPNPWSLLDEISRVQNAFNTAFEGDTRTSRWPRMHATETESGMTIEAELPGIDPAQVSVTLNDDDLTLEGKMAEHKPADDERLVRTERPTGAFSRTVTLPFHVDPDSIRATARNGILTITMERAAESKPRQIEVATN